MNAISRRAVVRGLTAGVPLATILADPMLARAAAAGLETVSITTKGGRKVEGALAVPAKTPASTILLFHEWWGLNDQIKAMTAEFAKIGYLAFACDLYGGKTAKDGDRESAQKLMQALDAPSGTDIAASWVGWLRSHAKGNGKVASCGWCLGGAWSLNASIATPVDATVIYYGRVNKTADELKTLKGPVLGHFATKDQFINKPMIEGFEKEMRAAGKTYTNHWYEADHAFANPTGARYDQGAAKLSWERTQAFLKSTVG